MMTISKPLSAAQAQAYHRDEFGNAQQNYYTEVDRIHGTWHGRLAEAYGLRGEVQGALCTLEPGPTPDHRRALSAAPILTGILE